MVKKSRRAPREWPGTCVYCGRETLVQSDHVIPRALFVDRACVEFVQVPSCRPCNVLKSKGEDDLRDYAVLTKDSEHHPDVERLFEKVERSIVGGHANIGRAAAESEVRPLITSAGIYLGDFPTAEINNTNLLTSLRMIVRGLYFHERNEILPPNAPVEILFVPFYQKSLVYQRLKELPHPEPRILGNLVFWWVPFVPQERPQTSLWLMVFFDQVVFVGSTGLTLAQLRGGGGAAARP